MLVVAVAALGHAEEAIGQLLGPPGGFCFERDRLASSGTPSSCDAVSVWIFLFGSLGPSPRKVRQRLGGSVPDLRVRSL